MQYRVDISFLPESIKSLTMLLVAKVKPKKVWLFGSRARGTYRANSDFDLAIEGKGCSEKEWFEFLVDVEEMPITL